MSREKKVLIIHGFGGRPDSGWRGWIAEELARVGVSSRALSMPTPEEPILSEWVDEVGRAVAEDEDADLYVVAHSLGVATVLRFLEGRGAGRGLAGAVLVSGPSAPTANEKAAPFLDRPFAYTKIRPHLPRCVIIHGTDDDVVPVSHAIAHVQGLGAQFIGIENAGHFNSSSGCTRLPEALEALLALIRLEPPDMG